MSLFKYINRIQTIHEFIERERTGTSEEFAHRIGISRSLLMEHLRELRQEFGAPIYFCRKRHTFYYHSAFCLKILITSEMDKVKGGYRQIDYILSNGTGLNKVNFEPQPLYSRY